MVFLDFELWYRTNSGEVNSEGIPFSVSFFGEE